MVGEPTYEELKQKILELEKKVINYNKNEIELKSERDQLLAIFDSIDLPIYVSDPYTYEILYANPSIQKIFKKRLIGGICYKEFQNLNSPCDFCTNHIILKNNGKPYQWEYHNPVVNTDSIVIDKIIKWPDGRDVRFEISILITDRKRAEEALRKIEERYRVLVETIPHGIQEIDPTGMITFSNSAHNKIFGFGEKSMIGQSIVDLQVSDFARAELKDYLANLMKEQPEPIPYIAKNLTKDGRIIDVQVDWDYKRDKQGCVTGFISVVTDITKRKYVEEALQDAHDKLERRVNERTAELLKINEQLMQEIEDRKRAEEALRENEKKYRLIFENIQDIYYEVTLDGIIIGISPSIEEISKYLRQELIGKSVYNIYADPEKRDDFVKELLKRGKVTDYEITLKDKDGLLRYCSITAKLLNDAHGVPVKIIGSMHDITDHKLVDERLRERGVELEKKTQSLKESNTALKVLLRQREEDKIELEEKVLLNVKDLVLPYLISILEWGGLSYYGRSRLRTLSRNSDSKFE